MAEAGFAADAQRGSTTGAEEIMVDGVAIDSAEAVVEHLERIAFPRLEQAAAPIDLTDEAEGSGGVVSVRAGSPG